MAKQKLKLLYLLDILNKNTDENKGINLNDIERLLRDNDITAERKSLYNDINSLKEYGIDIVGEKIGRSYEYKVINREFELPELKLLVDSVQASKFITKKKSEALIKKIEHLGSNNQGKELQKQVVLLNRVKTNNETIYYNVDKIHTAIGNNNKIKFQYFRWNEKKERVVKKDGNYYVVSPYALLYGDENYYLIAYDENNIKKHYRVDKMKNVSLVNEKREGRDNFDELEIGEYSQKVFSMYHGDEENVIIEFENNLAGVVIDRFGEDICMRKTDNNHFIINQNIAVSQQFFGWIMGLGSGVKILEPETVVNKMKEEIRTLMSIYMV